MLWLPPQSIVEESENGADPNRCLLTRSAHPHGSRLVFAVTEDRLNFDPESLLAWEPPSRCRPAAWRRSPVTGPCRTASRRYSNSRIGFSSGPWTGTHHGRPRPLPSRARPPTRPSVRSTELWHASLLGRAKGERARIAALWTRSRDQVVPAPLPGPTPGGLSEENRKDIVTLSTSDPSATIEVERLTVSALGASLSLEKVWNPPPSAPARLVRWQHRATWGREQYVLTESRGRLFPLRHESICTRVTQRGPRNTPSRMVGAFLRAHNDLTVTTLTLEYADNDMPSNGRQMPFKTVTLTTRSVAGIDLPNGVGPITVGGKLVYFGVEAAGKGLQGAVRFATPLIWIRWDKLNDKATLEAARAAYQQLLSARPCASCPRITDTSAHDRRARASACGGPRRARRRRPRHGPDAPRLRAALARRPAPRARGRVRRPAAADHVGLRHAPPRRDDRR